MREFAAAPAAYLIIRSGNDTAVILGVLTAPSDRGARLATFQRLHLGGVGFLPIAFVE
jgi:hypothetical protein